MHDASIRAIPGGRLAAQQPPFWEAEGRFHLLIVAGMCTLPLAMLFVILQGLPLGLPQWMDAVAIDLSVWMLLFGVSSFLLTPVALIVGGWSILRGHVDRRIKRSIAGILIAQIAAALSLLIALFMTGGRLPH